MITRTLLAITAGGLLAACQPAIPDSGRGVGFGDSNFEAEQRARDAALASNNIDSAIADTTPATTPVPDDGSPEATAAETARVLAATRPGGAPVQASPSNPAPAVVNAVGISNENNFGAVSDQRSIEADAARVAANRAQYQVVQPEALPERSDSGPNIVAYALQTSQPVGQQIYSRIGFNKARKYERACAQYGHADQAQIAFLAAGGPEKDRNGMDPDGDGFACDWDPTPFRRAAQG